MLQLKNIKKSFGERIVLDSLNLDIEPGKIYTLIGGNGSGKTTLFNIITGFLKPDSGTLQFNGTLLNNKPPYKINRMGITRTFQDLRLIKNITVRDNILLSFKNNNRENLFNALMPKQIFVEYDEKMVESANVILKEISLTDVADSLAGEISYGQQKLLTIGCCLANEPDLMLLDEPVAGIDDKNFDKITNIILRLKEEGRTILQIEHNPKYIEATSDVIQFLENGKCVRQDSYKDFHKLSAIN